jgi:uncharacterized membrane protein
MLEPILIVGMAIAGTAWYVQHRWRRRVRRMAALQETAGIEVLARRYARGEIGRDEFLQKRDDLLEYQGILPRRV